MKKIAWVLFSIWWLVACQQELPVAEENKEGGPIYLSAVVESQTASRAPYTYTVPNSTNAGKLYTTVLASSVFENGAYSFKHVEGNNGERCYRFSLRNKFKIILSVRVIRLWLSQIKIHFRSV